MMPATVEKPVASEIEESFKQIRNAVPRLRRERPGERIQRLVKLRNWIHANRTSIQEAMFSDFSKSPAEVDLIEVFHVLNELKLAINNLEDWAKPKKVDAPITMLGTRSYIQVEPRGACLIIAPWNYPFSLAVGPLVSALAAGNSVIIKPSELTPHVSALIGKMVKEVFSNDIVSVSEGGPDVAATLLSLPFDHIFFTGSPAIGKLVMKAAADNLASVTLELGGKSPAIITRSAHIKDAAQRTAVAKFVNNGQTCIAPDYVLADEKIADEFVAEVITHTKQMFSTSGNFEDSGSYCRIVNDRHFLRINDLTQEALHEGARLAWGGKADREKRFIHPMVLTHVPLHTRIMNEEIFGPVLPVITYKELQQAVDFINDKPKALALYIFTRDRKDREKVLTETSSGGVCVNDAGLHFLHHNLPFGGVNNSGIGKTHGHFGFLAFSNEKPVLKQKSGFTTARPFYPPYNRRTRKLLDWFLKLF